RTRQSSSSAGWQRRGGGRASYGATVTVTWFLPAVNPAAERLPARSRARLKMVYTPALSPAPCGRSRVQRPPGLCVAGRQSFAPQGRATQVAPFHAAQVFPILRRIATSTAAAPDLGAGSVATT